MREPRRFHRISLAGKKTLSKWLLIGVVSIIRQGPAWNFLDAPSSPSPHHLLRGPLGITRSDLKNNFHTSAKKKHCSGDKPVKLVPTHRQISSGCHLRTVNFPLLGSLHWWFRAWGGGFLFALYKIQGFNHQVTCHLNRVSMPGHDSGKSAPLKGCLQVPHRHENARESASIVRRVGTSMTHSITTPVWRRGGKRFKYREATLRRFPKACPGQSEDCPGHR